MVLVTVRTLCFQGVCEDQTENKAFHQATSTGSGYWDLNALRWILLSAIRV
jgi:hypothetical protein